jgi:hypothetical protein
LKNLLSSLPDPRKRKEYSVAEIVLSVIGLFGLKQESRNAINNDRHHSKEFCSNFGKVFGCRLVHQDTAKDFFETLPAEALEQVCAELVRHLINKKVFERNKLQGYYTIAVDGSGVFSSDTDRYGCGLTQESKSGKTTYLYNVLEARLVTACGLSIPIATEWITNEYQMEYDKQDCELKAFKRLAAKIKERFPRLPICILTDALYANGPVMQLCEDYYWKYIITLKDGNLTSVQDCLGDDPPSAHNSFDRVVKSENANQKIEQQYYWVNDLTHQKHWFSYLRCTETVTNKQTGQNTTTHFVRISNLEINAATVVSVSEGGRRRWKIENQGFNTLKNGGYAMQHLFSRTNLNVQKNYYQCMLIAHLINQFIEHSTLIQDMLQASKKKLTIKYLWQQLMAVMRIGVLCDAILAAIENKAHQVRLYTG